MHSPIQRAISEIKWSIPLEILQSAFMPTNVYGRPTAMNLDSVIRSKVIEPRVLVDCDLIAGTQLDIPLRGLVPERVELPTGSPYSWAMIYKIPMTLTQNRIITSVLWIQNTIAPISGTYTQASYNGSALANAAMGVMQSQAPIPTTTTARIDLINTNTVLVSDTNTWYYDSVMRCKVSYDPDLANLPGGAYKNLIIACELATKAYIYNTLVIKVNQGELFMGLELGKFKELLDSYADSNQLYRDHLDNLRETLTYADPVSARDWMRIGLGSGI